jgi:hypothetical protein
VDKADPDFHQDDKLGNRHSGLDPESVLMPKADPDFHQDDDFL